jgi:hypothetical protein
VNLFGDWGAKVSVARTSCMRGLESESQAHLKERGIGRRGECRGERRREGGKGERKKEKKRED